MKADNPVPPDATACMAVIDEAQKIMTQYLEGAILAQEAMMALMSLSIRPNLAIVPALEEYSAFLKWQEAENARLDAEWAAERAARKTT